MSLKLKFYKILMVICHINPLHLNIFTHSWGKTTYLLSIAISEMRALCLTVSCSKIATI